MMSSNLVVEVLDAQMKATYSGNERLSQHTTCNVFLYGEGVNYFDE